MLVEPKTVSVCDVVMDESLVILVVHNVEPGMNELALHIAGRAFFIHEHPVGQ